MKERTIKMKKETRQIDLKEGFDQCPACSYDGGFLSTFERIGGSSQVAWILVCPECRARYDLMFTFEHKRTATSRSTSAKSK